MKEERTTSKTGGQKGVKMARYDLIPTHPLRHLAEHFGRGALKYDDHNWRRGYEWSKSYSALMRHLTDFWAGKDLDVCSNDPDGCAHVTVEGEEFVTDIPDTCYNHTGSHHMTAVAWHAFVLLELIEFHPDYDDRFETHIPGRTEADIKNEMMSAKIYPPLEFECTELEPDPGKRPVDALCDSKYCPVCSKKRALTE